MPNRRLTPSEIASLNKLQAYTVAEVGKLAGDDPELLFALRRRLFTRLMHLERGTPAHRAKLKVEKYKAQGGLCAMCNTPLPPKGSELDRLVAWKGYTAKNTQLVHHDCHVEDQRNKGFTDAGSESAECIYDPEEASNLIDSCEIKRGAEWVLVGVEEALKLDRSVNKRCPACQGPVQAHSLGSTGQRAHFEHRPAHAGCKLKATGTPEGSTAHPEALE